MSKNNVYLQLIPIRYRSTFYRKTNVSLRVLFGWLLEKKSHLILVYNSYNRSILFSLPDSFVEIKLLAQQGKAWREVKFSFHWKKQIYKKHFHNSLEKLQWHLVFSPPVTSPSKSFFLKPHIWSERPNSSSESEWSWDSLYDHALQVTDFFMNLIAPLPSKYL